MISKNKAFNCKFQELPEELIGTFDIATLFLYNINLSERQAVAQMLPRIVKDSGIVIIGIQDKVYIHGDAYLPPVSESIKPYFGNLKASNLQYQYNFGNRYFIVATQPVKQLEVSKRVR